MEHLKQDNISAVDVYSLAANSDGWLYMIVARRPNETISDPTISTKYPVDKKVYTVTSTYNCSPSSVASTFYHAAERNNNKMVGDNIVLTKLFDKGVKKCVISAVTKAQIGRCVGLMYKELSKDTTGHGHIVDQLEEYIGKKPFTADGIWAD